MDNKFKILLTNLLKTYLPQSGCFQNISPKLNKYQLYLYNLQMKFWLFPLSFYSFINLYLAYLFDNLRQYVLSTVLFQTFYCFPRIRVRKKCPKIRDSLLAI